MCGQFAADEQDRMVLEQYRPYITMMNARANATLAFNARAMHEALRIVEEGLSNIKDFFERFGHEEGYKESNEVHVLKRLRGKSAASCRSIRRTVAPEAGQGREGRTLRGSRRPARQARGDGSTGAIAGEVENVIRNV